MGWNVQTVEARARWWALVPSCCVLVPSCCVSSSVTTWTGDDIKVDSLKENQGSRTRRRKNGNKASQKILQVPTYSGNIGERTHQARKSSHPDNRNRTCSYHGKQGKRVSRKRGMSKVSYIANIKENSIKRKKPFVYSDLQWPWESHLRWVMGMPSMFHGIMAEVDGEKMIATGKDVSQEVWQWMEGMR